MENTRVANSPMNTANELPIRAAAERIRSASTIALVLAEAPGLDVAAAAAALASALRAMGKTISVFLPAETRVVPPADVTMRPALASPFVLAAAGLSGADEPLREFIISFDLTRSPIKELKYERAGERLDIILSPTGRLRREDIAFRHGALRYDLAVTVGVANPEAAASSLRHIPELLHEKPVLNIDARPANSGYGEVNIVPHGAPGGETPSIAEMIADTLEALGVAHDAERASALLAALAAATAGFAVGRTSSRAFSLAGELLACGADPATAERLTAPALSFGEMQLAARAAARSRALGDSALVCLLIPEDFAKTAVPVAAVHTVFERARSLLPPADTCALLYQERPGGPVLTIVQSKNSAVRTRLEETAIGMPESGRTAGTEFSSFAAAEEWVRRLLARPDAVEY